MSDLPLLLAAAVMDAQPVPKHDRMVWIPGLGMFPRDAMQHKGSQNAALDKDK